MRTDVEIENITNALFRVDIVSAAIGSDILSNINQESLGNQQFCDIKNGLIVFTSKN